MSFSIVLYHIEGARTSHLNPELAASASLVSQLALTLLSSKHWDFKQAVTPAQKLPGGNQNSGFHT